MKCCKCGTELGQKNLCPVCNKISPAAPEPAATPVADFSREELDRIDEFVKAHPSDWNDEFEEFYDQQDVAANYRDMVSMCRHRAEIFAAVRELLDGAQKLSADLMIRIMDEIPKKYPEIEENEARVLAKEFFGSRKQIRQLTLRNTTFGTAFGGIGTVGWLKVPPECFPEGIILSWKCKKNDRVNVDDELCILKSNILMKYLDAENKKKGITPAVTISKENCVACGACVDSCPVAAITLNDDKPEVDKDNCILCESCLDACPAEAISLNALSTPSTVKSPWSGRIVSIRTEPVTKLEDVICEIETMG